MQKKSNNDAGFLMLSRVEKFEKKYAPLDDTSQMS